MKKRQNIWPFGKGQLLGSRTTYRRTRAATVEPETEVYKGYKLWPVVGGYKTSADPESTFEDKKQVKRFIDWARKNPGIATSAVRLAQFRELEAQRAKLYKSLEGRDKTTDWAKQIIHKIGLLTARMDKISRTEFYSRGNPGPAGSAFARCVSEVSAKGGAYDPKAVCAAAGRKKYGAKKFAAMGRAGKRKARRNPETVEYRGQRIAFDTRRAAYFVETMPRRGNNEFGWRYLDSAKTWIDGKLKQRRNPAEAAERVSEEFHGRPVQEIVEVKDRVHQHRFLAELGELILLVVNGVDGYRHDVSGFDGAVLCSNETKSQLFVRGGDQEINLRDFRIAKPHEVENLGEVVEIRYHTSKEHLGDEGGTALYFHKSGTTARNGQHKKVGYGPDLIYRTRDKALEFAGGTYEIKAEGIDK